MTGTKFTRGATSVLAALFLSVALAACEEQGTAEQAGEAVDQTMEQSADMVEEGAEKVEDAAEDVQNSAD